MKDIITSIKKMIKEEYKFIILLILLYIIFTFPINYYITVGGGISDVSSRIKVEDKYESKGSFNISYVTELQGTPLTYLLSFIIPTWERESASSYKYNEKESLEDIEFRIDLDLKAANSNATYWAYSLAEKEVKQISKKLYVISIISNNNSPLKVQDEIISIDGNSFNTVEEYRNYFQTKTENDTVKVLVKRNNKEQEIEAKLHKSNDTIVLGVLLKYLTTYETNPKLKIKFKNSESGPSGGLISALEIYNQLIEEDITNGLTIAGTGTIEEDGTIGEIGGVEHKILGAVKEKTDVFLVPAGTNYKQAKKYIKKNNYKIKLIPVSDIKEAINKLKELK